MRLTVEDSIFVAIDFQDRLLPHMVNTAELVDKTIKLITGMNALGVPSLITQQYTKGLGYTDQKIAKAFGYDNPEDLPFINKDSFSAFDCSEFREKIESSGRKNVIISGIEGHVCVLQTIVDLQAAGFNCVAVADCISSRTEKDYQIGLKRWEKEQAFVSCFESILFEFCRYSGTQVFREISALVK